MSPSGLIRSTWLLYFSKPAGDRQLLKAIKGRTIRSIVEIGVGDASRIGKVLEVLGWNNQPEPIRYTGIDLFEARPASQPRMPLKSAFQHFKETGAKFQLVPGDPYSALARTANSLAGTDLLLIGSDQLGESLDRAMSYLPRMIHGETLIFQEEHERTSSKHAYRKIAVDEIQKRASAMKSRRAA